MKTKEFIEKVEALGYSVRNFITAIDVCVSERTVVQVSKKTRFSIVTNWETEYMTPELWRTCIDYAATLVAEREEEKRYYLRFIHPNILGAREPFYLHLHHSESAKDYYDMGTVKAPFGNKLQTIFTESEIAEMDVTGFEKVEVSG